RITPTTSLHDALPIYKELARLTLRESECETRELLQAGVQLEGPYRDAREIVDMEVRDEIAEAVNPEHHASPSSLARLLRFVQVEDRKSTRLNSSHVAI